ncbi:MAG TPA: hypothetical protein VLI92_00865 [Candidatus Saccharimonadales bacterium]|nr:hypothetical protein [Candidatus Saccharimonadales bacterium]
MNTILSDKPAGELNTIRDILPKKVAILYSEVKREYFPTEDQYKSEVGVIDEAKAVAGYLNKMGIETLVAPGNYELSKFLEQNRPDMVFNLVQSVRGHEELEPTIAAMLELMEIPYTGTGMLGLSITHNKYFTKKLLEQVGLPVPRYQLFNTPNDPMDGQLKFPLISKLNEIHGSVGIDQSSVSEDEKQLRQKIKDLLAIYKQPILVEEFIVGSEITCVILEGTNRKVYAAEKNLPDIPGQKYKLATFDYQWNDKTPALYLKHDGGELLRDYIKNAFDILKMDDYAKFDLRQDASGRYYFIDCNANPAFGPKEEGIAFGTLLDMFGIPFEEALRRLIENTIRDSTKNPNGDIALDSTGVTKSLQVIPQNQSGS